MLRFFDDTATSAVVLAQQVRQQLKSPLLKVAQQPLTPTSTRSNVLLGQRLMTTLANSPLPTQLPAPPTDSRVVRRSVGNDTLTGGNLNDLLLAGRGNDTVNGGEGNDWLFAGTTDPQGNGTLNGNGGFDVLIAGVGNDTLNGNGNNDWLFGYRNNDTLNGNEGDDRLFAGDGNNTLNGNGGNDLLVAGPKDDTLNGNEGNDTYAWGKGDANDLINESAGDDDRLLIKQGVTADQLLLGVAFETEGDHAGQWRDLKVGIAGTTDSVTINNQFVGTDKGVETLELWNGKSITQTELNALIGSMQWHAEQGDTPTDISDLSAIEANPTLRNIIAQAFASS
jgi:hypothetical protein